MSGDTWGDAPSGDTWGDAPVETLGDAPGAPVETLGQAPSNSGIPAQEYWGSSPQPTGVHGEPLLSPTVVDVHHLDSATQWLAYCKQRVEILIRNLKLIPGLVDNAVHNGDVPDGAKPPEQNAGTPMPRTGPPGTLPSPGPTKFGLFPNAIQLAHTHVETYNSMLASLTTLSNNLQKALDGTAYIAKNYRSADDAAKADIARIMIDPPYVPQEQ